MTKDFKEEFEKFKKMLEQKENFAFCRFSDGEMFIMQNQTVVLAPGHFITGNRVGNNIYTKEEQKEFHPAQHQFYREKLIDSFKFREKNYFKGICSKTDVGSGPKEQLAWNRISLPRTVKAIATRNVQSLLRNDSVY